jgi:hypothetical protein
MFGFARFGARFTVVLLATVSSVGCYSQQSVDAHAEMRRQKLLEIYPPRVTTKEDVRAKWNVPPQIEASRPLGGWDHHSDGWVRSYGSKAELRIGRQIPKLERYFGADGFFSLCYCWFYYVRRIAFWMPSGSGAVTDIVSAWRFVRCRHPLNFEFPIGRGLPEVRGFKNWP